MVILSINDSTGMVEVRRSTLQLIYPCPKKESENFYGKVHGPGGLNILTCTQLILSIARTRTRSPRAEHSRARAVQ